jgi:hypothetical protein
VPESDLERLLKSVNGWLDLSIARKKRRARQHALSQPYTPIAQQLEVNYRNTQSACSFGGPAGWRDLSPEECSLLSNLLGSPALAGVTTERTDWQTTNFTVASIGTGDEDDWWGILANPDSLLRMRLQAMGARPVSQPMRVMVDGQRGILLQISSKVSGERYQQPGMVDVIQSDVFARVENRFFSLTMGGPAVFHEHLLPAFWTMLGTLRWPQY